MKKIIIFLFLLITSISFVFWYDNKNDIPINKNVSKIETTLKKYQSENNYIDYDYLEVSFWWVDISSFIDLNFYIKNQEWNIINYNWLIDVKPLLFWSNFTFGEIPKSVNILNWKWNIKIKVTSKELIDYKSWLWLVLTSENKDLVWNIMTFGDISSLININDYISKLIPGNFTKKIDNNLNNKNKDNIKISEDIYNQNQIYDYYIDENWNPTVEYLKGDFDMLNRIYWKSDEFYWNIYYSLEYYWGNNIPERKKRSYLIKKDFYNIVENWNLVTVTLNLEKVKQFILDNKIIDWDIIYIRSVLFPNKWTIWNPILSDILWNRNINKYTNLSLKEWDFIEKFSENNISWYDVYIDKNDDITVSLYNDDIKTYLENKYSKYIVKQNNENLQYNLKIKLNFSNNYNVLLNLYLDLLFLNDWSKNNKKQWYDSYISKDLNWDFNIYFKSNNKKIDTFNWFFDYEWNTYSFNYNNNESKDFVEYYINNINSKNKIKFDYKINNDFYIINISKLFFEMTKIKLTSNKLVWFWFILNEYSFDFYNLSFLKQNDFLSITSKIKSPKDISTNPFLVWLNIFLALLYLLTFYFTSQLFNSYFEELSNKKNWNEKISNFFSKLTIFPIKQFWIFLDYLYKKIKFSFWIKINNKIWEFLKKYEHKIFIVICFVLLWIIWQIIVDDFDVFSIKWWYTIGIMMFILWFIILFKDILLYLLNKKNEKDNLKIETISTGYILAFIVALFWRFVWMIPWVMFGSVIKISAKSNITSRKIANPKLLFKILLISFSIWIICWLSTLLFSNTSFIYKFLMVTYFWLVNDVFFALLPFWMLWWIYILKDKTIKIKWFIFTFIVFLFLLHTIINPEWDLNKILKFDGNFLILISILFFWILITIISYFYIKLKK